MARDVRLGVFWLTMAAISLVVEAVTYFHFRHWFLAVQGGHWVALVFAGYYFGRVHGRVAVREKETK